MATIYCSKCGAPNADGSSFCSKCGTGLAVPSQPVQPHPKPYGVPLRRKKAGLKIAVIAIVILAAAAGICFGVIMLRGGTDKGYYDISGERIPSVAYALGETRKLQSVKDADNGGVQTLSCVYNSASGQDDMRVYADYLQRKENFSMRTATVTFDQKSGAGIQLWRNAETPGFMIIVQLDYDEKGYTVTIIHGAGQGLAVPLPPTATDVPAASPASGEVTNNPPATAAPPISGELYENSDVGFSITLPEGWQTSETVSYTGTPAALVTTANGVEISIVTYPGFTMEKFLSVEEEFWQSLAKGAGYEEYSLESAEDIKLAGYDCRSIVYTLLIPGAMERGYIYALESGSGKLYFIMLILPPTAEDTDKQEISDVLATLKIQ